MQTIYVQSADSGGGGYKPTPLGEQHQKSTPVIPSSADGTPSSQQNNLAAAFAQTRTFGNNSNDGLAAGVGAGGAGTGLVDHNFMQHIQVLTKTLLEQQQQDPARKKIGVGVLLLKLLLVLFELQFFMLHIYRAG